eukprot:14055388-Alexandrium_andersonii.AAC.1
MPDRGQTTEGKHRFQTVSSSALPAVTQPMPQHYRAPLGGAAPPGDAQKCWGSGCATAGSAPDTSGDRWKPLETAGS